MNKIVLLMLVAALAACSKSESTETVESLVANPARLKELRQRCKLERAKLRAEISARQTIIQQAKLVNLSAQQTLERRVAAALGEMRHVDEFDFVIINKDLQTASEDLAAVVRAARLRLTSQRAVLPEMFRFLEQ